MYKPGETAGFTIKQIFIGIISLILIYHFFIREESISYGSGVYAGDIPLQSKVETEKDFKFKDFDFNKLVRYDIKAKVLSRKNYSDFWSVLSPVDLALGWGNMSDEGVLENIDISQRGRWYYYAFEYKDVNITQGEIAISSANTHIIPANEDIENSLNEVIKGNVVELSGYLVNIKGKNGRYWNSSTSRNDTGGGACEVFYVESLTVSQL